MRVLLVSNYEPDVQLSMLGFASTLKRELPLRDVQVESIAPAQRLGGGGTVPRKFKKWAGYVDKYVLFPRRLRSIAREFDLVHVLDQGNGMYIPHLASRSSIVTCHDLLAIRAARNEIKGWETSLTGKAYQSLILKGLRHAKAVACVSKTTRADFLRIVGIPESAIRVIYNGLFHSFHSTQESFEGMACLRKLNVRSPYLIHVGGNQPYKNRIGAVQIFKQLKLRRPDLMLILVGNPADLRLSELLDVDSPVISTVSNDDLCHLYSSAEALLFPSTCEGFGLPILEAQACGCPVFTSNKAPMTEVGGNAAVYFDSADPKAAATTIFSAWETRAQMRELGFLNAANFTTENMIAGYVQFYRELM